MIHTFLVLDGKLQEIFFCKRNQMYALFSSAKPKTLVMCCEMLWVTTGLGLQERSDDPRVSTVWFLAM